MTTCSDKYIGMNTCGHACSAVHTCLYPCLSTCLYTCLHTGLHTCPHTYICPLYAKLSLHMSIGMSTHVYTHIDTDSRNMGAHLCGYMLRQIYRHEHVRTCYRQTSNIQLWPGSSGRVGDATFPEGMGQPRSYMQPCSNREVHEGCRHVVSLLTLTTHTAQRAHRAGGRANGLAGSSISAYR